VNRADLASQRLSLYRGNLGGAWNKALAAAYPVLRQLVGGEFFGGLARAYGKAYASQSGDLNRFGEHFADFLRSFPHVAQYPCFPDMAILEWACHRAHYAQPSLGSAPVADIIASLAPEQLDAATLTLHPACRLFASEWAVVELWLAHQPEHAAAFPEHIARPNHGLTVRSQWKVGVLPQTPAAYQALSTLQQGATLGSALDAALAVEPGFDFGFHLRQWLEHSVFDSIALAGQSLATS